MRYPAWVVILITAIAAGCKAEEGLIAFNDSAVQYEGRINFKDSRAELAWPGTMVRIQFEGKAISAVLKDTDTANYYNVILDGQVISKLHPNENKQTYPLASGLPSGKHTIELFKRTEWDKGKTFFYGFKGEPDTRIIQPTGTKKRKIEFYGNSITCGYGMEDSSGDDSPKGYFENNYLSYAALTARHFNAAYSCISKSGIGMMVSWFPLVMPEMYDRLDPLDDKSKWNFLNFTPDVVVINIFQNDSWIINNPAHPQFIARFGTKKPDETEIINAYKTFVGTIRNKYPKAYIICALGNMDATREGSQWPGYIMDAVGQIDDANIFTCFFTYKNTPGHPKVNEQKVMADSLITFINKNINW